MRNGLHRRAFQNSHCWQSMLCCSRFDRDSLMYEDGREGEKSGQDKTVSTEKLRDLKATEHEAREIDKLFVEKDLASLGCVEGYLL